ncbi:MAG: energy transducer TonB [bacterium]
MREKKIVFVITAVCLTCMLFFTACSTLRQTAAQPEASAKAEKLSASDTEPQFVPFDNPPTPIGGYDSIYKHLAYPEIARRAGIEGRVVIWTQINKDGNVTQTKVKDSLGPNNGCDESAMNAIKAVQWTPGMKDGKPVNFCWVAVPVEFKLK